MARPKKPEEKARIRDVAFGVFARQGFENSSFSDIAKAASVSKSLVQYYFPKKEQFLDDFIDRSLAVVDDIVTEDLDYEFGHELGKLYAIGYAQFNFAMYNERMNTLRMDIIRDRANTEMVVEEAVDWIVRHTDSLPSALPVQEELVRKTIIYVVGGAFDYMYDCMSKGVTIDPEFLSDTSMQLLNRFLPEPFTEGEAIRSAMTPEWLDRARRKYNRRIFIG